MEMEMKVISGGKIFVQENLPVEARVISTETVGNGTLHYTLFSMLRFKDDVAKDIEIYGIALTSTMFGSESCCCPAITANLQEAELLLHQLADHTVLPSTFFDVIYDFVTEKVMVW